MHDTFWRFFVIPYESFSDLLQLIADILCTSVEQIECGGKTDACMSYSKNCSDSCLLFVQ